MRFALLIAAGLLGMVAAGATAQTPPPGQKALREPEATFVRPRPRPPPSATTSAATEPVVPTPVPQRYSDIPDSAPRLGGLREQRTGGGVCRTSCANEYYRCLRGEGATSCGGEWALCQTGCPDASTSE